MNIGGTHGNVGCGMPVSTGLPVGGNEIVSITLSSWAPSYTSKGEREAFEIRRVAENSIPHTQADCMGAEMGKELAMICLVQAAGQSTKAISGSLGCRGGAVLSR